MADKVDIKQESNQEVEVKKESKQEVESLDASVAPEGNVTLVSKNKKEFVLEKKFAWISNLVKTTLDQDPEAKDVPIPGVDSEALESIVSYMDHHKGQEPPIVPKPLRSKEMKDVCSDPWDATFIDKIGETRSKLYDLILAANYMDIKSLLHLGCAKVASLIKGQPLEKIKDILSKGAAKEEGKKEGKEGEKA